MSDQAKRDGKETEETDKATDNDVKLLNSHLYFMPNGVAFSRIMRSIDLDLETGGKVYELFHVLTKGPKTLALHDTIKKLCAKLKTKSISVLMENAEFSAFMDADSGVVADRIKIKRDQVKISVRDRVELEFLFDFIE